MTSIHKEGLSNPGDIYVYRNLVDEIAEETTDSLANIVGVDIECQGKNEIPIRNQLASDHED